MLQAVSRVASGIRTLHLLIRKVALSSLVEKNDKLYLDVKVTLKARRKKIAPG